MKKIILIIVFFLVAAFVTGSIMAVKTARRFIEEKRQNILGLALEIKSYDVDWKHARLVLEGITIYPAGQMDEQHELASAESLFVEVSPLDVLKKKEFHAKNIIFEKPKFSYIQLSRKEKNWDALDTSELKGEESKKEEKEKNGDDWLIRIDQITIKDGEVEYKDKVTGQHLELNDVDVDITNIVNEPDPKKLPTSIHMEAQIDKTSGHLKLDGNANLLGKGINFDLKANLSSMSLLYFAPFYAGSAPFAITSGSLAMSSTAKAEESMLHSNYHVSISGLHVSDGLKAKMVDAFLEQAGRHVDVNASVSGNLETGEISIGSSTSKAITDQVMSQAMANSPLGKPEELLKKGGEQIQKNVQQKIPTPKVPTAPKIPRLPGF